MTITQTPQERPSGQLNSSARITSVSDSAVGVSESILNKYATSIVPKDAIWLNSDGEPQVNQQKTAHFEERGYKGDEVLWIAPKDCLRLEFEDTPEKNKRYVEEIESACKTLKLDYCITGHGGKSDYVNIFNLKGIPLNEDNKNAKMLLVNILMPQDAKNQLDRTNLGWTLSPVIGHSHWKPKYKGSIHRIIRGKSPTEHNNEYPKELLSQLKKSKTKNKKHIIQTKQSDSWVEDFLLNFCCSNELPKGARHYIIEKNLAAFIIHRQDKDEVKQRYLTAQGRNTDTLRNWESAILNGNYDEVSPGELVNFIKEYQLPYIIQRNKTTSETEPINFYVANYVENVESFYKQQPFYYDEAGRFFIWSNKSHSFRRIDEIDLINALDKTYSCAFFTVNSSTKWTYIEAFKKEGRKHIPKRWPKNWIQFDDKAYDVITKQIIEPSPEYDNSNPIPWKVKVGQTPKIDKLLKEWLGDDGKKIFLEIAAWCCIQEYFIQRIIILHGRGSNGKGEFMKLLEKFLQGEILG